MPERPAGPKAYSIHPAEAPHPDAEYLTAQEKKSVTHGSFWIPEGEREIYKRALALMNEAEVPYVVTGAYAIYEHTGLYRETKDLDVFVEPRHLVRAVQALRRGGFRSRLEQAHWIAKGIIGEHFVDVIYGMGNGIALVDEDWYRYATPAILAATPVRMAPAEELIWHRLFISERHRQDMADIQHLILCRGHELDWDRLVHKSAEHWPLLLAQLQVFLYAYPQARDRVPERVVEELLARARDEIRRERTGEKYTRGPLISRFSFAIDVNEWDYRDAREERVLTMERQPVISEIARSEVWDEMSEIAEDFLRRMPGFSRPEAE